MRVYFVLILLIFLPTSVLSEAPSDLGLELKGVDELDEKISDAIDLERFWIGEDADHLYLVAQFVESQGNASVVITLLTNSNDRYLISAWSNGTQYSVYIAPATSLSGEAAIPAGEDILVQYIDQRVYYNSYRDEIGFYIDWSDIGGKGDINLVVWNLLDGEIQVDKMPNDSSFSYSGVSSKDRVLDFNAALNGAFETFREPHTTEPATIETTIETTLTTSSAPEPNPFPVAVLVITILAAIGGSLFYLSNRTPEHVSLKDKKKGNLEAPPTWVYPPAKSEPETQMRFVEELDRMVKACCYQTARIGDVYCFCGRAVEEDVSNLFINQK